MPVLKHRYDFVYLFDVENGNPNGDPDAGNLPTAASGAPLEKIRARHGRRRDEFCAINTGV
jgi:CRISPR/Cas system type I-B associated protein Csh2 (Cas7 group RAMP superfamily)